jgi:hypothetical protein
VEANAFASLSSKQARGIKSVSNAMRAGASSELKLSEQDIKSLLAKGMSILSFARYVNLEIEEGLQARTIFKHGIQKHCPYLSFNEAIDIFMELAVSGENYSFLNRMTTGFFKVLKERFPAPAKQINTEVHRNGCDLCRNSGIAILPEHRGGGSAACVCEKGRFYFSSWIKEHPRIVDLANNPHLVLEIRFFEEPTTDHNGLTNTEISEYYKRKVFDGKQINQS